MNTTTWPIEDLFRDALINKIIVVSAYLAVAAYISAQLRAFDIGLTYRDIEKHSEADFSHGLFPNCMKTLYPDLHKDHNLSILRKINHPTRDK